MKRDFAMQFTGGAFIVAAILLWGGWMAMPTHLGHFFETEDFAAVRANWLWWIWMYRMHLFGMVIGVIAFVALAALVADRPARVLVWPGVAVASAGLLVGAVAAAFYYHFGAWGALDMEGKPREEVRTFVGSLRLLSEYVTCLVRFGRVFGGLGLVVVAAGLVRGRLLPRWLGLGAALIGVAAMGLTMGLPDDLWLYQPVFHLHALWLVAMGFVLCRRGLEPPDA